MRERDATLFYLSGIVAGATAGTLLSESLGLLQLGHDARDLIRLVLLFALAVAVFSALDLLRGAR